MVTAMPLIGIRTIRKVALFTLMPAVVLIGASCSSFNREWRKVGRNPDAPVGLEGHWEGNWISEVNHHHGKLRCIVSKDADVYWARFHAKYLTILSFGYTVQLNAEAMDNGFKFKGEADLGVMGGVYHYAGHAEATNFFSTYSSKYDHGTFQMQKR
jgi:hypothetical protein